MINLNKEQGINLSKGYKNVRFHIVWNSNEDIDIEAIALKDGKATQDLDFVFYGNLNHPSGAITHSPDVRNGGEEYVDIDLDKLPDDIDEIQFSASIDRGEEKGQHFGNIQSKISCNLEDLNNSSEIIASYDPSEEAYGETVEIMCRLIKQNGLWRYEKVGESVESLEELLAKAGLAGYR